MTIDFDLRARTLEEAIQICKARLPMYDLGQCNAVRECISSIEAAKHTVFAIPLREPPAPAVGDRWLNADSGIVREWDGMTWVEAKP